jgi:hypothetical protein
VLGLPCSAERRASAALPKEVDIPGKGTTILVYKIHYYNDSTGLQSHDMRLLEMLPNGATIEFGEDLHGNQVHRVCNSAGLVCKYVEPYHCALTYARQYEACLVKHLKNAV